MEHHLLNIKNRDIGLSKNLEWIIGINNYKENLYFTKDSNEIIFWLPFLEIDFKSFCKNLQISLNRLIEEKKISQPIEKFPIDKLIITALESSSEYWVNLALLWLFEIDNYEFAKNLLEQIFIDHRYSQKVRHMAKKLLKKCHNK